MHITCQQHINELWLITMKEKYKNNEQNIRMKYGYWILIQKTIRYDNNSYKFNKKDPQQNSVHFPYWIVTNW